MHINMHMQSLHRKHTYIHLFTRTWVLSKAQLHLLFLCAIFQDFVHHFHVLLPSEPSAAQAGIREFLQGVQLDPDGYQVGKTMVSSQFSFISVYQYIHTDARLNLMASFSLSMLCTV